MCILCSFRCRQTKRDDDYQVTIQPDDYWITKQSNDWQTDNLQKKQNEPAAKRRRKCSRSLAASLLPATGGYPALLTKNGRHREAADASPSGTSALCCAARLREMSQKTFYYREQYKDLLWFTIKPPQKGVGV